MFLASLRHWAAKRFHVESFYDVTQRAPYLAGLEHCFSVTPFFTQTNASQRTLSYKSPACCVDAVCEDAVAEMLSGGESHAGGNNGN